jgi:CxxC motif-containing protein (DUF1111 family)
MVFARALTTASVVAAAAISGACNDDIDVTVEPGAPLPGLTEAELVRFEVGQVMFTKVFLPEEGLGPLYTENSCNACHHQPETGGGSDEPDMHGTVFIEPDSCDPMKDDGGFVRNQATPLMRALGVQGERPPVAATGVGRFHPPVLYGLGLIEAIPEETIVAMADPDDSDGDGISGRVSRLADGRLGRFRRKSDRARIVDLSHGGVRFAIGLTTPVYPSELPFEGGPVPPESDPVPEPEIDIEAIESIADFIRFLAPPKRYVPPDEADRAVVARGEQIFDDIGCAACHVPVLRTGPSEVAALDRKAVPLYSDLLLHDMGPDLADVCGPTARPSEIRTQMLWGLQYKRFFMHDGRTTSLRKSLELHDGESAASRDAFSRLDYMSQLALLEFLSML